MIGNSERVEVDRQSSVSVPRSCKFGVVGAGVFGTYHARKYAQFAREDFVGVFDPHEERAAKLAQESGCKASDSLEALLSEVDAVSITSPAIHHFEIAKQCLEAGIHVFVEKPLATSLAEADLLIGLAKENNLILQTGHQERFVFESFGLFTRQVSPIAIEGVRFGPFTGRAMDVDVVLDLMTHDLDLMHQVNSRDIAKIQAKGKRIHSDLADEVSADLVLDDGCEVRFQASRIAEALERSMKLVYSDGIVEIDFVNRTLKNTTKDELTSPFTANGESPISFSDPLGANVDSFIQSVRCSIPPKVTGADGRRALESALKISQCIEYN